MFDFGKLAGHNAAEAMRNLKSRPVSWGVIAVLTLAACPASINEFVARPNVVCAGSTVELSWEASNDGILSTKTPASTLQSVGAHGSQQVSPASTTTYRLEVAGLTGSAAREVEITVVGPSGERKIGQSVADPRTTCVNGVLTVVDDVATTSLPTGLTVVEVRLPEGVDRTFRVQHAGREIELNATNRRSDQFGGLPVVGKWQLSTPLSVGESCGTPTLPPNLTIVVNMECKP